MKILYDQYQLNVFCLKSDMNSISIRPWNCVSSMQLAVEQTLGTVYNKVGISDFRMLVEIFSKIIIINRYLPINYKVYLTTYLF